VLVAVLDRAPEVGRDDAVAAAQIHRLALGPDDDPGDGAVAGQPAGAGGGDDRAEAHLGGTGAGGGSTRSVRGMVTITCGLTVRSVGSPPAASWLSATSTSASPSCCERVRRSPLGRSACTIDSSIAWNFSPPTASSSPRNDSRPSSSFDRVSDRPSVGSGSTPSGSSRAR
jgi:hypothetical protein